VYYHSTTAGLCASSKVCIMAMLITSVWTPELRAINVSIRLAVGSHAQYKAERPLSVCECGCIAEKGTSMCSSCAEEYRILNERDAEEEAWLYEQLYK